MPAEGDTLADYVLGRVIGRGGGGTVHLAQDRRDGRWVALKLLPSEGAFASDARQELRTRFLQEADIARRLQHPDIVSVHAAGEAAGSLWLAMELVLGCSLERYVQPRRLLPPPVVAEMGLRLARALAHAHSLGVVHRDIKPSNVLVDLAADVLKLTDFGTARMLDSTGRGPKSCSAPPSTWRPSNWPAACPRPQRCLRPGGDPVPASRRPPSTRSRHAGRTAAPGGRRAGARPAHAATERARAAGRAGGAAACQRGHPTARPAATNSCKRCARRRPTAVRSHASCGVARAGGAVEPMHNRRPLDPAPPPPAVPMTIEIHAAVDPGRARSNNEDAVATDAAAALAVLADGMGGYNAGEVASSMATTFVRTELGRWLREASGQASDAEVRRAMDICVDNANRAIFNAANSNPQYAGMGTTLVVAVFRDNRLLLGHVGDSRCYRLRGGRLAADHARPLPAAGADRRRPDHARAGRILGQQEPRHAGRGRGRHGAAGNPPTRRPARRRLRACARTACPTCSTTPASPRCCRRTTRSKQAVTR